MLLRQTRLSLAVTRKKSRRLAAHASVLYICFLVTNKISDCGADPFHRHLNDCGAKHRSQNHNSDQDRQEQIRPLHFINIENDSSCHNQYHQTARQIPEIGQQFYDDQDQECHQKDRNRKYPKRKFYQPHHRYAPPSLCFDSTIRKLFPQGCQALYSIIIRYYVADTASYCICFPYEIPASRSRIPFTPSHISSRRTLRSSISAA